MIEELGRVLDEAEAGQLPALIAEWSIADPARRELARLIRIDLALTAVRPELAIPCLVRRRAPIDAWVAAWAPGKRWLRALGGPWPLPAGIVEEYRTDATGSLAVRDVDGAGVIGIAGAIAWDRGTGRTIDPRGLVVEPRSPWRLITERMPARDGRAVLDDGTRRVELETGDGEAATHLVPIGTELAIVITEAFDYGDAYDHASYLIDPARGRVIWRAEGRIGTAGLRDGALVCVESEGLSLRDVETGAVGGSWGCFDPGELAIAPDGAIVTYGGGVIRVWDPDLALAAQVAMPARGRAWRKIAFSPDGAHVFTAPFLARAGDPAVVRVLDVNGPGWLEGGPPRDCQRLGNAAFMEITPFAFRAWRTTDGELAIDDRRRGARHGDLVAFDAAGERHAVWSRGGLVVHDVASGARLFEAELAAPARESDRLGFSADGTRLFWRHAGTLHELAIAAERVEIVDAVTWELPPEELAIVDGLLAIDDLAIPCDDERAVVSPTGRELASEHERFVIEG